MDNYNNHSKLLNFTKEPILPPSSTAEKNTNTELIEISASVMFLVALTTMVVAKKAQLCCFRQNNIYDQDSFPDDSSEIGLAGCCCFQHTAIYP